MMTMRNCQPGCVREGSHAAPLECWLSNRQGSGRDAFKDAVRAYIAGGANPDNAGELYLKFLQGFEREEDPTRAPAYYVATQRANGIEPGAEMLDWICATRGRDAAINYLRVEMLTKTQRLGLRSREAELRDVYKIEQACAKLRGLILGGSDDAV